MVTPEKMITPGNETVINSASALLNIFLLY